MKSKVPWTKTMLEKFIEEALLTEDEERILRTRVAGWSIAKQSLELNMSASTVSRMVKSIRQKYLVMHSRFPDLFPVIKPSKYDNALDVMDVLEDVHCVDVLSDFKTTCGKDLRKMTVDEIIKCQKSCPYEEFYVRKN